jgi:hypothetical protein
MSGNLGDSCTISGNNGKVFKLPARGYLLTETANPDGSFSGSITGNYAYDLFEGDKGLGAISDGPSVSYITGTISYNFLEFTQITKVQGQVTDVCKVLYG